MKSRSRVLAVWVCGGLFFAAWLLASAMAAERTIQVTVSGSMFGRIHTLSNIFEKENPGTQITINLAPSVDDVIAEFLGKPTTVAMTTRHLTEKERQVAQSKGIDLAEHLIGYGGIVIITDTSNPVSELTVDQVRMVFRGDVTRWNELGGNDNSISVFRTGQRYPGTTFFMQEDFLLGQPFAIKAAVEEEFSAVMRMVSQTPGSIGYTRIRDAFESPIASEFRVKVVKIKKDNTSPAIMPSRTTVNDATYPIRRPYYLYLEKKMDGEAKKFVDFILKKGWGQQTL
jgi:phosphate transport system substrate-binding protein